jgi:aspartyl-tRNA(Asn)/glutamyl-tRNA(Gln) amidotransferase subunit A
MRPTYGRVSRYGLIALASSMDTIGPITRSVADARAILSAMSGYDSADATSLPEVRDTKRSTRTALKGLRIGMPKEYLEGVADRQVREAYDAFCDRLRALGAALVGCSLPTTAHAIPAYYVLMPAEASSNLARYDGVRFGHPGQVRLGHRRVYAQLRGERFGMEPKRRIMVGAFTLSAGYADRYYHAAQRVRTLIREEFDAVFRDVDMLVTPATPTVAFPLGSVTDPLDMYRQDVFMSAVSLAGTPAVSVPAPVAGPLPVGIQFIAPQNGDGSLLDVAEASLAA